jgi:uncharacterized membrane protein
MPIQWRLLIVICLMAGIFFRFINFEAKVYQYDETFTSLRVSGYTELEAVQYLSDPKPHSVAELEKYQAPSPNRSVVNTVKGLAAEETQLTPLYFVLARFWSEWFGDSITAIRSLSAVASVLALPSMGWLCLELFESYLAAWVGVALLAVSPFQVVYAQEARPNGLWVTAILLTSAALLRAMRTKKQGSWLLYAVTLAVSFYTYLFSGLVAVAHVAYVAAVERFRPSKRVVIAFLIALCLATLTFLPWLLVMLINLHQVDSVTSWTTEPTRMSLSRLAQLWLYYISLPFIDRGSLTPPSSILRALVALLHWGIRILVVYSFYLLCRRAPARVWLFVVTLTVIPALALVLPDLLFGGTRTTVPRYLIPFFLGLQLAVTYLLSRQLLLSLSGAHWRQWLWRVVAVVVFSVGIGSCAAIAQADTWWNKMISNNNPEVAQIINQTERPLVVSDADLGDILSLSHYLDPKVRLLLRPQCYACNLNRQLVDTPFLPKIPTGFSDVFFYHPRPKEPWMSRLKQQKTYQLTVLSEGFDNWFWKVKQPIKADKTSKATLAGQD